MTSIPNAMVTGTAMSIVDFGLQREIMWRIYGRAIEGAEKRPCSLGKSQDQKELVYTIFVVNGPKAKATERVRLKLKKP